MPTGHGAFVSDSTWMFNKVRLKWLLLVTPLGNPIMCKLVALLVGDLSFSCVHIQWPRSLPVSLKSESHLERIFLILFYFLSFSYFILFLFRMGRILGLFSL